MTTQNVADDPQSGNVNLSLREKIALFGDEAIPLILPYGSKGDEVPGSPFNNCRKNYHKRTHEFTLTPEYQHDLYGEVPHNTGMRQGGGMTKVAAWDVDTDDEVFIKDFLDANPICLETFTTKGSRGFTCWFIVEDEIPKAKKITLRKNVRPLKDEAIEWRSNGYSVIDGLHPDTQGPYVVLRNLPVKRVKWAEAFKCPGALFSKLWPQQFEDKTTSRPAPGVENTLSAWQRRRRIAYVNYNYDVTDWKDEAKAQVICKNKDAHGSDTGDTDTVIFIGSDKLGVVSYSCSHTSCASEDPKNKTIFNNEESARLRDGFIAAETFILHNQTERLDQTLKDLFEHMASLGCFYRLGDSHPYGMTYWRPGLKETVSLSSETLVSCCGREHILFSKFNTKGKLVSALIPDNLIKVVLGSDYASLLPALKFVNEDPLLVKTAEGAKLCGNQYVPELETIVIGDLDRLPEMKFEEGRALIDLLMDFWVWREPVDRARAWSELLTPAMLQGGFLKRPIPSMLIMADEPHAGKTIWHSTVNWIYKEEPNPHVLSKYPTIGSLEEQLKYCLSRGAPFFFIDELAGTIQSTMVNALITGGDEIPDLRIPYGRFMTVSTEKIMIQMAGVKGFVVDPQLATRTIPIRIMKPAETGTYHWAWPDGTLLKNWIIAEAPRLLSAIYSVIAEWDRIGSPGGEAESRFPSWSIPLNGLLAQVLALPHATAGLEEIQGEISSIASCWWPEFFLAMVENGLVWNGEGNAWLLSAASIQGICEEAGIGVPGSKQGLQDAARINNQIRQINVIIGSLTNQAQSNSQQPIYHWGEYFIIMFSSKKRNGSPLKQYVVSSCSAIPVGTVRYVPSSDIAD